MPISLGGCGNCLSERAVQHRDRGQASWSACVASIVASLAGSPLVGVVAAGLVTALVGLLLALLSMRWRVDYIIGGVVVDPRRRRDHELRVLPDPAGQRLAQPAAHGRAA